MTHRPRANAVRLFLVVALFQAATFAVADEASTARRFELAKESEPQLIAFLKDMPKGADLHSHVSGAVYAESRLDAAIDSSLFFDPKTGTFTGNEGPGMVPARDLRTNSALAAQYLGMQLIYLEAGSGAPEPIPKDMISAVKRETTVPLIVGGGIRTKKNVDDVLGAGADIVVTGTAVEAADDLAAKLSEIVGAVKMFR